MVVRRQEARRQVAQQGRKRSGKKLQNANRIPRTPMDVQATQSLLNAGILSLVGEQQRQTGILRGTLSTPNLRAAGMLSSYSIRRPRGDKGWQKYMGVSQPTKTRIKGAPGTKGRRRR